MKNLFIFGLFLLLSSLSFGQSVPDTETFSLQNVVDAVNPTTDDLTDCFNDAIESYFNAGYKASYYSTYGNLNNLLMFRDYGPHNASSPATIVSSIDADYTTSSSTYQVSAPSNMTNGDILYVYVMITENYTISVPSGFTSVYNYSGGTNNHNSFMVAWKFVAEADKTATFTSTIGSAATGTMGAICLSGSSANPPHAVSAYLSSTNSTTFVMNNASAGFDNSMNLAFFNLEYDSSSSNSLTLGWTSLQGLSMANIWYMGVYYKQQSGDVWDNLTITGGTNGNGVGGRIQVKP